MYSPRSEIPTKEKNNSLRKRKYMYQLVIIAQKYPKENKKEPEANNRKSTF